MKMPFGKHRGAAIHDLPDDYLEWLHGLDNVRGRLRKAVDAEWRCRQWEEESRRPVEYMSEFDAEDKLLLAELIRSGYRQMAMKHHPDVGGNPEVMRKLNALMERLRQRGLAA